MFCRHITLPTNAMTSTASGNVIIDITVPLCSLCGAEAAEEARLAARPWWRKWWEGTRAYEAWQTLRNW
jgi:hypothetical protein